MKTVIVMLAFLACLSTMAHAQAPVSVHQLVRKADFVGVVQAEPSGVASQGEWRQTVFVFLQGAEAIKGVLVGYSGSDKYTYIKGNHAGIAGYPTRFGERGEYLVFLHRQGTGSTVQWTTLAAYRVQYYPDGLGGMFGLQTENVVGLLTRGTANMIPPSQFAVTITEARQWLGRLAVEQPLPQQEEAKLAAFFHASLLSAEDAARQTTPTHEERLALATKLADAITLGTTRAQVEKIFPQSDGGALGSDRGRYFFGSEVMISVPYDTNGGPFRPENRVNGPLRVYRDMMHID